MSKVTPRSIQILLWNVFQYNFYYIGLIFTDELCAYTEEEDYIEN